jgi:hypothetical protein
MKELLHRLRDNRGSSLVESMVAFSLLGGSAIAVYPMMASTMRYTKSADYREICEDIVRGKLEEYLAGKPTVIADAAAGTGTYGWTSGSFAFTPRPQLASLSAPTSIASAQMSGSGASGVVPSGGFMYAKIRYNAFYPESCLGLPATAYPPPAAEANNSTLLLNANQKALNLGMRECIGTKTGESSRAWADISEPDVLESANCVGISKDDRIATELPGFKLYVRLELDSPWKLNAGASPGAVGRSQQFTVDTGGHACPDMGMWTQGGYGAIGTSLYDFDGDGDGIKVTVTGVIDVPKLTSTWKGRVFNGIQIPSTLPSSQLDWAKLTCTAAATIRQDPWPVRYFVRNAQIQSILGHALNGAGTGTVSAGTFQDATAASSWPFATLTNSTTTGSTTHGAPASTALSFAVHPRDLSIWMLKAGSIIRYSNCGGQPIDCNPSDSASVPGVSDDGTTATPQVQEFDLDTSLGINMIAVDFKMGQVYGVNMAQGSWQAVYQLLDSTGTPLPANYTASSETPAAVPASNQMQLTDPRVSGAYSPSSPQWYMPPQDTSGNPLTIAAENGFFISPDGSSAYLSQWTNGVSAVYRFAGNVMWPLMSITMARGFSK